MAKCPICCKPLDAPYRRLVAGRIVEGCISTHHEGHLAPNSADARWHEQGRKALARSKRG